MVKQTLDASAHTNFLIWIVKERGWGTPTENAGLYTRKPVGQPNSINLNDMENFQYFQSIIYINQVDRLHTKSLLTIAILLHFNPAEFPFPD